MSVREICRWKEADASVWPVKRKTWEKLNAKKRRYGEKLNAKEDMGKDKCEKRRYGGKLNAKEDAYTE